MDAESEYGRRLRELERDVVLLREQVRQTTANVDKLETKIDESTKASYSARGAAVVTSISVIVALALEIAHLVAK